MPLRVNFLPDRFVSFFSLVLPSDPSNTRPRKPKRGFPLENFVGKNIPYPGRILWPDHSVPISHVSFCDFVESEVLSFVRSAIGKILSTTPRRISLGNHATKVPRSRSVLFANSPNRQPYFFRHNFHWLFFRRSQHPNTMGISPNKTTVRESFSFSVCVASSTSKDDQEIKRIAFVAFVAFADMMPEIPS